MQLFNIKEYIAWGLVIVWLIGVAWPHSYWYEIGDVVVPDYSVSEPLILSYDGKVKREFTGSYSVVVTRFPSKDFVDQSTSGRFIFEVESSYPEEITIEWWANVDDRAPMSNLGQGRYRITTCWTVYGILYGIIPPKTQCTESNVFEVY